MALFKILKGSGNLPTAKTEGWAYVKKINNEAAEFYVDYDANTRLQVGKQYNVVSATEDGIVPKFDAADGRIDSNSSDWVLTNNNGSLGWYRLPTNAFKNDNTNTTYTLSGAASGNTWVTTLTGSDSATTTSTVPAASTTAAGLMTPAMVEKLNGIAAGATANKGDITQVTAGDGLTGGATSGNATLSANLGAGLVFDANKKIAANTSYTSANKNYAVKTDSSGALYVNVPWSDTDTHHVTRIYTGASGATANATSPVSNPYITVTDNNVYRTQVQLKGGGATSISADDGVITISSTNTTYSAFKGASASANGGAGLVPAPAKGQEGYYLRGDGVWFNLTGMDESVQNTFGALQKAWKEADSSLKDTLTTLINGKAQTNHASSGTSYGISTASLYGHAMASSTTPKASAATAAVGSETAKFARGDHVHPLTVANSWSGGVTAGPKIKTTINGVDGTAVAIPKATASVSGVVIVGDQTFGGIKRFSQVDINATYHLGSFYNYGNGCLIDIGPAKASTMVAIHITGNSYTGSDVPINSLYQVYDYGSGTTMNCSGISIGQDLGDMKVYRYNNRLYAHVVQKTSYSTLNITLYTNKTGLTPTVTNAVAHATGYTDLVTITPSRPPLADSGVTAGSYGPSANASPAHGGTFSVPYITFDAKGRATAASTKTITLPTYTIGNATITIKAGTGLKTGGSFTTNQTSAGTITLDHSNSITAGSVGTAQSPSHGGTFAIPKITYDAQGHITAATTVNITLPADNNTDTKVTQTVTTSNAAYPLLLAPNGQTATTTTTSYFDSGVTLNPSTNTIAANISGNAATASSLTSITETDKASSSDTWRRLWMSYSNNTTGRPAYDDRFAIQTSTGTLKAPIFSGALSGNASTATTASKLGSATIGNTLTPIYLNGGTATACETFNNRLYDYNKARVYHYSFGGAQDLNWKKVFAASHTTTAPSSANYVGATIKGTIYHHKGNYNQAEVDEYPFQMNMVFLSGTSVSDTCTLKVAAGCPDTIIRAVRVSANSFELQVRQPNDWQTITIQFSYSGGASTMQAFTPVNSSNASVIAFTTLSNSRTNIANQAITLARGGDTNYPMQFNWSGQSGQPSWLWGGNDGTNMYVYNPSNFNVNYANSAGSASTAANADKLDGYHASSFGINYNVGNADLNAQINSGFYRLGGTITNGFTDAAWGQMLVVHGGGDTIGQIGIPYNASGLYVRQGNPSEVGGSGSWKSWVQILDSSNYTSYTDDRYVNISGDTMTGTLILSKTTDASGTANNKPALIVGGTDTQAHIEIDANEIMAKASGTTVAELHLNANGGKVNIGNGGLFVGTSGISTTGDIHAARGAFGGYNNTSYALSTASFICNSWVRTNGATGWYNQTYDGGWYMTDGTYVRSYNSKAIYVNNNIYVGTTAGNGTGLALYSTSAPTVYGIHMSTTSNYGKFGDVQSDWATYFNMNAVGQRGWIYRAGSTNVASISANGIGAFKGITTSNRGNSEGTYYSTGLEIREYNYSGAGADSWGQAPRLSFHWSGRVAAQIGLASNGYLYTAPSTGTTFYKLVYESGTWGISISGNASTADALRSPNNGTLAYLDWTGQQTSCSWFATWDDTTYSGKPTVRAMSAANMRANLNVPTRTGGNASGTWGINITGSAGSVAWANVTGKPSTFTPASHTHNYAGSSSAGGAANSANVLNINATANLSNCLQYIQQSSQTSGNDLPSAAWWHVLKMNHGTGDTYFKRLLAFDFFSNKIKTANAQSNGTVNAWKQVWVEGDSVTGAVWNDYAEYRESDCQEFGRVLSEKGDDTLTMTTERLQPFAGISSDTWGFCQGETEKAKTPIAVAGRVLAYTYKDRNEYKPGDCVCAAPNGTVDIMTREEIIQYPDRIVGTVSCVPDYETWGSGDRDPVQVDGRIWIKVK